MSRRFFTFKRILLLTPVALLAAILMALAWVPQSLYSSYLEAVIVSRLAEKGIIARVAGLQVSPTAITIKNASAAISPLVTVEFNSIRCSPRWLTIVKGTLAGMCDAKTYEGNLSLLAQFNISEGSILLSFDLKDVQMAQHPQLAGLGITSGRISVSSSELNFTRTGPVGKVSIRGAQIEKPEDSFFSLPSAGVYLAIPKFSDLSLNVDGDLLGGGDITSAFSQSSSLGEASGTLNVRRRQVEGEIRVELSDDAKDKYGELITMASSGTVPAQADTFSVDLSGTWPRIKSKILN